jgi:hypothetical protein
LKEGEREIEAKSEPAPRHVPVADPLIRANFPPLGERMCNPSTTRVPHCSPLRFVADMRRIDRTSKYRTAIANVRPSHSPFTAAQPHVVRITNTATHCHAMAASGLPFAKVCLPARNHIKDATMPPTTQCCSANCDHSLGTDCSSRPRSHGTSGTGALILKPGAPAFAREYNSENTESRSGAPRQE